MKLQPVRPEGLNVFTAYGEGYVDVNAARYSHGIVVLPERVIENWTTANAGSLSLADFEFLAALDAEIVLLGTGARLRFPGAELLQPFMRARKGIEAMDNHAACRAYNVLAGDGRKVAAALILDRS
ncbi:MAG: Mth938-like domain-containing protein [Candidatus Accumulibacter sp.]|nr:Mth938-like domain-containing protein [Accumulibacter sp.]